MPAIEDEIEAAIKEGIELRTQLMPSSVEPGGLKVIRTEPGERDASGRFQPVPVAGSEELVEADTIVAAVGQVPDGDALEAGAKELECTVAGLVEIDHQSGQSSHELVFAGGDLVPGSRTVTEAIATGQRAARGIDARLRSEQEASRRPAPPIVPAEIRATRPGIQRADRVERQAPAELEPGSRRQDFEEVVTTLTEAQARREASRCMVCGTCANCRVCLDLFGCPAFFVKEDRIHIDPELCMGCGVCADLCPNGAIRLVSDAGSGASGESALGPIEAPAEEMDK